MIFFEDDIFEDDFLKIYWNKLTGMMLLTDPNKGI